MRNKIIDMGGTFYYNSCLTDIVINNNKVTEIVINDKEKIKCETKAQPYMPEIETKVLDNGHITKLTYDCLEKPFYILTGNKNTRERQLDSGSLEDALINRLSNGDHTYDDLSETFSGSFKNMLTIT